MQQQLTSYMQAGVPVILWGPPGVGKTATVEALARATGAHLETVILSVRDPADVGGYPIPPTERGAGVALEPPAWAVRLAEAAQAGRPAILFLDELTTAPPSVQAAALRVVLDRAVGELQLPRSVWVVAAANPPEHAAGAAAALPPPLANRFAHLNVEPNPGDWAAHYPAYWGAEPPGGDSPQYAAERARIAAFIRRRPELLLRVPADPDEASRAWPSPRAWDHAARAAAAGGGDESVAACVGEGAAAEYVAWRRAEGDLPDPADVVAGRAELPPREREDARLAALMALAAYCGRERGALPVTERLLRDEPLDVLLVVGQALAAALGGPAKVPASIIRRLAQAQRSLA